MKNKKIFLIAIPIVVLIIVCGVFFSVDINKTVNVTINTVEVDEEYLKEFNISADTEGKKVVSGEFVIKNYSVYNICVSNLQNDKFESIFMYESLDPEVNLSPFSTKELPYRILVDEDMSMDEIKEQLSSSTIETMTNKEKDGTDAEYTYLSVDSVK